MKATIVDEKHIISDGKDRFLLTIQISLNKESYKQFLDVQEQQQIGVRFEK